jgi:colicin import membrane protein
VALHAVVVALIAAAAFGWRSDPPPQQLAIEGSVVRYQDLPSSVKAGKPLREPPPPVPEPKAQPSVQPAPEPEPEPEPAPPPDTSAAEAAAAEARAKAEAAAAREAALERERAAEAQRQSQAREREAQAAQRKAEEQRKADEQKRQQEALAAREKKAREEQAARDAKLKAEREAELRRALASEEEGEAIAQSGVVDEYRALLIQTIERNWRKPDSARPGLECTLYVTQAPGGVVLDVKIGECNGDAAVKDSVANAVLKSSPLPPPRDPRAFERRLVIVFKPKE